MAEKKYNDKTLADLLYPTYLDKGTVEAVYGWCVANNVEITKPTLGKMARHFDWARLRAESIKSQFAATPTTGDQMLDILIETAALKLKLRKVLEHNPADMDAHRMMGTYIGIEFTTVREIRKTQQKTDVAAAIDSAVRTGGLSDEAADEIRKKILGASE